MKSPVFPSISITNRHDVDIIVKYFRYHRLEFDEIVNSWIEDVIKKRPQLVNYYHAQMSSNVFRYRPIDNLLYKRGRETTVRRNIQKLSTIKQRIDNIRKTELLKKKDIKHPVYKAIALYQPVASMVVLGLLKEIRSEGLSLFKENETVFVYAKDITQESKKDFWADNDLYGNYHNALIMGAIKETSFLPCDSYVGFIKIGKRTDDMFYVIKEAHYFEKGIKTISQGSFPSKPLKGRVPKISFENRTLRIPVNKEIWEELNRLEKHFYFYWKQEFKEFYSSNYGLGDADGLYDIIFFHGIEEKLFEQKDQTAVSKEILASSSDNRKFTALYFDLKKLSFLKTVEGSSFDVLQKKEWVLDWNCVKFKQGYLVVFPPVDGSLKFKPKAVPFPGVLESFNYLKDYLNDRLQPVYCSVESMKLTIYDTIRLNEAIEKFTTVSRQRAIKTGGTPSTRRIAPLQMSFKQALSKAQKMTPEDFQKYKSKYIDFLVMLQSKKYKVIPCVERLSHANSDITEYAFMFSIECSTGRVLIVHENINPDRSTLLFLVKDENYNNSIKEIYDFLQGAEINKRSSLRDKSIDIKNAGVVHYRSINHDDLYSWKQTISTYKRYR